MLSKIKLRSLVGSHPNSFWSDVVADQDPVRSMLTNSFREAMRTVTFRREDLYSGVIAVCSYLYGEGTRIFIASNKLESDTLKILDSCGLSDLIEDVVGTESFDPKPCPDMLLHIRLASTEIEGRDIFMLGDRVSDVHAAVRAEVVPMAVSQSYDSAESLASAGAVKVFENMEYFAQFVMEGLHR